MCIHLQSINFDNSSIEKPPPSELTKRRFRAVKWIRDQKIAFASTVTASVRYTAVLFILLPSSGRDPRIIEKHSILGIADKPASSNIFLFVRHRRGQSNLGSITIFFFSLRSSVARKGVTTCETGGNRIPIQDNLCTSRSASLRRVGRASRRTLDYAALATVNSDSNTSSRLYRAVTMVITLTLLSPINASAKVNK